MADALKPVYLLVGSNRPRVDEALKRLRSRVGPDAVEHFFALETSGEDVVAACNSVGLFVSGARALIVEGVERWKAADTKAVVAYLESPAPDTVLALVAEQLKPDSALSKAVAKHGEVLRYELTKRELPSWVSSQARARGASISAEAVRALLALVGESPRELETELDKLVTWAAGAEISDSDVELLVPARGDSAPFGLTDAWGRRDTAAVLSAYEELLERASEARSSVLVRLSAVLASHVGKVRACQRLAAEGVSSREAAGKIGMHPYAAERAFAHARNFTEGELRAAIVRLAQLDLALKGASRLPGELEFERALLEIS